MRVRAEHEARRRSRAEEIRFGEIYAVLAELANLDAASTERLQALELQVEREVSSGVPSQLERVRELLARGERVVLISDMYLPESAIRGLIAQADATVAERCPLYVSSEWGRTKGAGSLFRLVCQREGIGPRELRHAGDNLRSDLLAARRTGASAERVREAELRSWERLGRAPHETLWQRRAGAARLRRLEGRSMQDAIGYSIAGPILGAFTAWTLREAVALGRPSLCFLARDGWMLAAMARELQSAAGAGHLDLRYLYGSRQAWRLPAMVRFEPADRRWALGGNKRTTLRGAARRIGFEPELLSDEVERETGRRLAPDEPLDASLVAVLDRLLSAGRWDGLIEQAARRQAELFDRYLEQECGAGGAGGESAWTLVDLGWQGSMQDALRRFLDHRGRSVDLLGLYFGLTSGARHSSDSRKRAFATSVERTPLPPDFFHDAAVFLESLATACHGSTVRYECDDQGRVAPQLDEQGERVAAWGYDELLRGALDYVREHAEDCVSPEAPEAALRLTREFYEYLQGDELEDEFAECFGAFPFTPDSDARTVDELGPRRTWRDGLRYVFTNSQRRMEITAWPQATARRSGPAAAFCFGPRVRWFGLLAQPWRLYDFVPYSVSRRVKALLPRFAVRRLERLLFGRSFDPPPRR